MKKTDLGYPTLSDDLHLRLFGHSNRESVNPRKLRTIQQELKSFGITVPIDGAKANYTGDLPLPPLKGENLKDHFEAIAEEQIGEYFKRAQTMVENGEMAPLPPAHEIIYQPGWTRYEQTPAGNWDVKTVPHPLEDIFCFDTETFVEGGNFPIIGTALSSKASYLWLASELLDPSIPEEDWDQFRMIPVGTGKFIFGHNVSFDRIRSQEAYTLGGDGPENFWFDTLSAHVGCSGLAHGQRWIHALAGKDFEGLTQRERNLLKRKPRWFFKGATNSLVACYNYHVAGEQSFFDDGAEPLDEGDKKIREIFVKATDLRQINDLLGDCVEYALKDVVYTTRLFFAVWPKYINATPSLVGLCGHYHLNGSIIPLVNDWREWIEHVEEVYHNHIAEMTKICKDMMWALYENWKEADDFGKKEIEADSWCSQLDWEVKTVKGKYAHCPNWVRPYIKEPDAEIGVRTRLAHLLLRLEWEGAPIENIPGDGWCFRNESGEIEKIPHPKGNGDNVGGLLTKDFVKDMEVGRLSSSLPDAKRALEIANALSYWTSVRKRVMSRIAMPTENPYGEEALLTLPEILPHGTYTRRTVENLMITMCSTKNWRIGTELKTRVSAPEGWKVVGADVDGEEVQIASIYADAWNHKTVGATPLSYMTLMGDKRLGTDPHTTIARQMVPEAYKGVTWSQEKGAIYGDGSEVSSDTKTAMKTAREVGKIANFSVLYGSGVKGLKGQIRKFYPEKSDGDLFKFAHNAIKAKKGEQEDGLYFGGTDSGAFNMMEDISMRSRIPQLPCLGTKISTALRPDAVGDDFRTGRMNWTIQSSGAEFLAIFLTAIHWLGKEFKIPFRFVLSIHDEIWCICPEKYAEQFSVVYQMAHMYTWGLFHHRMGMEELPLNRAFFSGVAIDDRLRKTPYESTVSPSNQRGAKEPNGEEYTMAQLAEMGAVRKLTSRYQLIQKGSL